ncbi:exodeoxyribonuclease VII large subunit [Anaerolineales bacterium HSG6]|nr:exodeoxyribonuclease VII large subunit [Anaerolineales bacterium HSG6]MDM8532198.1 exodeoxyribonuclease VII large subunit [Anaerolineales bacterium HSG25]
MSQLSLFSPVRRTYTVSELTRYILGKFEKDRTLQDVWLEGEVSNWRQAASGHVYFTLKDKKATIKSVIWRSQARKLRYKPQVDGETVLANGRISVYEAGGNYQFYVDSLEPMGQGNLQIEFEQLKQKLSDEGLFASNQKQDLPLFPQKIGIVTSSTGAALQDILTVLQRRYPLTEVILAPALVQGKQAPAQIIRALQLLLRHPVDVIILARGGGSLEDLWAFNDETLARTIFASSIPIVTGVGHEIDYTIADFVADVRAPTPSAAAELTTPDQNELVRQLNHQQQVLSEIVANNLGRKQENIKNQAWRLTHLAPHNIINNQRQTVDRHVSRLNAIFEQQITQFRQQITQAEHQLEALNPEAVLARGYAIIQKETTIVTHPNQVMLDDQITIKLHEGQLNAVIVDSG